MKSILAWLLLVGVAWCDPVVTFTGGTEDKVTERFRVSGPWRLSWKFQGTALKVLTYSDERGPAANPVRQVGSGNGSIDIANPGTFWLDIKSVGNYELEIETTNGAGGLPVFEGNLERKGTPVFTAPKGWGYRWQAQGVFNATLYDDQRREVGRPVVGLGGGSGREVVGTPGRYFFMIQSTGPYRIEILQNP